MKSTMIISMTTMDFVLDLDQVGIMEKGALKEFGNPRSLLSNKGSFLHFETKNVAPMILKQFNRENTSSFTNSSHGSQHKPHALLSLILGKNNKFTIKK